MPEMFDNTAIAQWQAEGSAEITARDLLDTYEVPKLDLAPGDALRDYIARRERESPAGDAVSQTYLGAMKVTCPPHAPGPAGWNCLLPSAAPPAPLDGYTVADWLAIGARTLHGVAPDCAVDAAFEPGKTALVPLSGGLPSGQHFSDCRAHGRRVWCDGDPHSAQHFDLFLRTFPEGRNNRTGMTHLASFWRG